MLYNTNVTHETGEIDMSQAVITQIKAPSTTVVAPDSALLQLADIMARVARKRAKKHAA